MDLASQDAELKAALFRFVDVVPACRSLDDLARHLTGFLDEVDEPPPPISRRDADGRHAAPGRAALGAAAAAGVKHMAHRFIVGETPQAALGVLRDLWKDGVATSVDLLGEATVTAAEADRYAERCAEALDTLADAVGELARARPRSSATALGAAAAREPVGEGLGAHAAAAPRRARARQARRRRRACARCCATRASSARTCTSTWSRSTRARRSSSSSSSCSPRTSSATARRAGIVLQAYLRDSPEHARRDPRLARRGAGARARRSPCGSSRAPTGTTRSSRRASTAGSAPVFEVKADCDRNFEALTRRLLDAAPAARLRVAIASHNLRSVAHAIAYNRAARRRRRATSSSRSCAASATRSRHALAAQGLRVRTYCPVGDLVAGMAYLVRRLLENTSQRLVPAEQASGVPLEELLAAAVTA